MGFDLPPACKDDKTWHGKFNVVHTCDFVADNTSVRCEWEDSDGVTASEACPVSCDTCDTYPSSPSKKTKKIKKTKKPVKAKKRKKTNRTKNATKEEKGGKV